jgi:hypothetical protein
MPIVVMNEGVNASSLKRSRQQDLPTPESPMSRSLTWRGGEVSHGVPYRNRSVAVRVWEDSQGSHSFVSRPWYRGIEVSRICDGAVLQVAVGRVGCQAAEVSLEGEAQRYVVIKLVE